MRRLRDLFAKREDPYAGVDLANASRVGGAVSVAGAAIAAVLLPFAHPDEPIGDAGWAVAATLVAAAVAAGWVMGRMGPAADVNRLLAFSYGGLAAIAAIVWLSGGKDSPYAQLFLIGALYTCAIHPPRRVLAYLPALVIVALLPLTYSDWSTREIVSMVAELAVWMVLGLLMLYQMSVVRAQRLGLRREGERARQQARVDQLTELPNRRAFDEALSHALDRAHMTDESLSVLVADIDDFKDFNDRCGHLEGDRMLRLVADAMRGTLRRPDMAYRWGGDEFAVILPDADLDGAEGVAERLRSAVAANIGPDGTPVEIAVGAAEFDRDAGQAAEALLLAADRALLDAKGSGAFEVPGAQG
ncbi:MAG: GGDEF domain-containing protein [Thermoleophilaceae bacterium]